jgi:hypothetical protein
MISFEELCHDRRDCPASAKSFRRDILVGISKGITCFHGFAMKTRREYPRISSVSPLEGIF